jgi:NTE family protein
MGKMLNAVLLDRLDGDVDRLRRINQILEAGEREYGPGFVEALNRQLVSAGDGGLRRMSTVVVRTSTDIGALCAEYVRSEAFGRKVKSLTGRAVRRMAGIDSEDETDLLSYLLFDGAFAGDLIALGESDARARHDDLCELFESALSRQAA